MHKCTSLSNNSELSAPHWHKKYSAFWLWSCPGWAIQALGISEHHLSFCKTEGLTDYAMRYFFQCTPLQCTDVNWLHSKQYNLPCLCTRADLGKVPQCSPAQMVWMGFYCWKKLCSCYCLHLYTVTDHSIVYIELQNTLVEPCINLTPNLYSFPLIHWDNQPDLGIFVSAIITVYKTNIKQLQCHICCVTQVFMCELKKDFIVNVLRNPFSR